MNPIFPPNTPKGLAYTPGFILSPGSQFRPLGLISPKRAGVVRSSFLHQVHDCLANLSDALAAYGPNARAIKVTRLMVDVREIWSLQPEFDKYFVSNLPASTLIEVTACSEPGIRFELDVWAEVPTSQEEQGTLGFANAGAGDAAGKGAVAELNNALDAITDKISASGALPNHIVKLALYLADMRLWPACQDVILSRYQSQPPVIVPIGVPKVPTDGACLQVEAAFIVPPEAAKEPSDVAAVSPSRRLIAMSGQPAIPVFVGGLARDTYNHQPDPSAAAQTRLCLKNLENILVAAGSDWDHVFKTTWYVTDVREWRQIQEAAQAVFGRPPPFPTVVEVSKLVAPAVRVEPDVWAVSTIES